MKSTYRNRLLTTTLFVSASVLGTPAFAQDVQEPVVGEPAEAVDETQAPTTQAEESSGREIVVTGSRIARPNLTSNSPIAVVTGEEVVDNADITLETFLNTLPQANPAGTTTSNNPGNGGAANINLRGLGSNRNLVLIDGRRPMVGSTAQDVDLNTIPQGLIERIEVITGGAGATYGADAIAGAVNIIMKDDFEGIELRGTYSNTIPETDAREYQIAGTFGGNFDDGRGNLAVSVEYANRQSLQKGQREFAAQATSTTGTPPVGRVIEVNPFSQAALNTVFGPGGYGAALAQVPGSGQSLIHFNADGSLFSSGIIRNPLDVVNYQYDPLGQDSAAANQNYFPDQYFYNFDLINFLVLPLTRKSAFAKGNYEINDSFNVFVQGGYTEYQTSNALAPTPVGVRIYGAGTAPGAQFADSTLINPNLFITNNVIPVTNPFIPADLATLLASRTGDDPNIVGSGATEPFRMAIRTLSVGLRETKFDTQVLQGLIGVRGNISDNWRYEVHASWGRTSIDAAATGNVDVQKLQELLEAPDGGASICAGGYNPFGIQPVSQECVDYINETGFTNTTFTQRIIQGYVQGDIAELPAGTLSIVAGAEHRKFDFIFDPGALFGPIAGFNTADPAGGGNRFLDFFGEALIPLLKDQPFAKSLELSLGIRKSTAQFIDRFHSGGLVEDIFESDKNSDLAYKAELSWEPIDNVRVRASYQRAVRAPNFGELFAGGGSFPQIFDPCSVTTQFRLNGGNTLDPARTAFCQANGINAGAVGTFQQNPGGQAPLGFAGNTELEPEKADTWTAGVVFQKWGFTGSLDYYNIHIKKPIFGPDPNLFIAACFNYLGGFNSGLDESIDYCDSIVRSGGQISFLLATPALGGDSTSNFILQNFGKVKTSGIDFQLGYNIPTDFVDPGSKLSLNLLVNYLIDFKVEELPGVTLDYADTVSYFGQGLGTSFPRWKGVLNAAWQIKPITLSSRVRYIDGMKNRASVQFPGEEFTGTDAVWYFDFAAEANIENYTLRIGVNNAFDKKPPVYAPNVQSGTDPSLFDVIGRRAYVSAKLKF